MFRESEYGAIELSCLVHKQGVREYYQKVKKGADEHIHVVEPVRGRF
jgi:hypothetical protein